MTQPQTDPASDVGAALARLAEQTTGLQRQISNLAESVRQQIAGEKELTDAKFVQHLTMIDTQADKVALALASSDKATSKAETANEKRFESVNEFRAQLTDQARTFMPRAEAEAIIRRSTERIEELTARVGQTVDRSEIEAQRQRDDQRFGELATRVTKAESAAAQAQASKAQIIAVLGIVCTVIVAVVIVANALFK